MKYAAIICLFFATSAHAFESCEMISPASLAVEACADYDSQSSFALSPAVREAKNACLIFYRNAWEGNLSLCRFSVEVKSLQEKFPNASNSLKSELVSLDEKARAKYRQEFQRHYVNIRELAGRYMHKIGLLNTDGHATSAAEMNCTFSRNRQKPGPVAGMLEMGLAAKAHFDFTINQANILSALRMGARSIFLTQEKPLPRSLSIELESEKNISRSNSPISIPEAPEDPTPDSTHSFWAINSIVQYYAEEYGDAYLAAWAKQFFRAHPAIFNKVPLLAKKFPQYAGTVAAAGLGVGLQYVVQGKVSTLDLVSIGVTAYSFGAGLFLDLAIGAYRDNQDKRREYAEFVKEYLETHSDVSSGEIAQAWAKENKKTCLLVHDPFSGRKKEKPAGDKPAGDANQEDSED